MKPSLIGMRRSKVSTGKRCYSTKNPIIEAPQQQQLKVKQEVERSISSIIAKNARGTGGRSSISGIVATVFGASGFLGRYVVNELGRVGSQVVIPYRGEENHQRHLKLMGDLGQIVPLQCDVNDPRAIEEVISRSNVVVNLIGKRWATNNFSLNTVNNIIPENIAKVAKKVGIEKFVHVSALGASPDSPSEWLRTKYAGEVAVRNALPDAVIVRPAAVFGYEDRVLNKWAVLAAKWPFLPILKGYENRKEAYLWHSDFSKALYRIIISDNNGETFELGGEEVTTEELVNLVQDITLYRKKIIRVPLHTALKIARWYQLVLRSRFTVDEVHALTRDNVVNPSAKTLVDLEITPSSIKTLAPRYIKHFRNPVTMLDPVYE